MSDRDGKERLGFSEAAFRSSAYSVGALMRSREAMSAAVWLARAHTFARICGQGPRRG